MKYLLALLMTLALSAIVFGADPRIGSNTSSDIAAVMVTPGNDRVVDVKVTYGYGPFWRINFDEPYPVFTFDGKPLAGASDLAARCASAKYGVHAEFTPADNSGDWTAGMAVFTSNKKPVTAVAPQGMVAVPAIPAGTPLIQGRCTGPGCQQAAPQRTGWYLGKNLGR